MSKIKDFIRGIQVLSGNKPFAGGDRNLAIASDLLQKFSSNMGVGVTRNKTVEATNRILDDKIKKNPKIEIDELLKIFRDTPAYMDLLKDLDMGDGDLIFLANEALGRSSKNDKGLKK